ncbi:MAG: phytanoyl-CoA dioxygenase family protein [Candidatus Poribacteria bacterium]|nr:phytanoyl-CoA dioxygenase family protein [Candidatus Poribacteria bacterium]
MPIKSLGTAEQVAYFETFGFLVLRQAFRPDEMASIGRVFDQLLEEDRQGRPFLDEKLRLRYHRLQSVYGIVERHPLLMGLVEDDRIYETVEQLLGHGCIWLCSEGNLYLGDTKWHPDGGSTQDHPFIKVSLYLDALTKDTGCLRVIPGSHRSPLHEDLKNLTDREGADASATPKIDVAGPEVPCIPLESQPGDVFFLNMNLWHASFGGRSGRRHLAANFAPKPTHPEHTAMLEEDYHGVLNLMKQVQYSQPGRVFSDAFLHSDSPRIQRLVSKWVELGLK